MARLRIISVLVKTLLSPQEAQVQNSWEDLKAASFSTEFGLALSTDYTHLHVFLGLTSSLPWTMFSTISVLTFQLGNCSVFTKLHDDIIHQAWKIRTLHMADEALLLYYTPVPTSVLSEN